MTAPSDELVWHERAAFHVTFDSADDIAGHVRWQIHVYHEESDSRAVWSGMPDEAVLAWMCDKTGLTTTFPTRDAPADLQLAIGDLRLDEALIERQDGGPNRAKGLRAEVDFQLSGTAASLANAQQSQYVTQILACALTSGVMTILAADQQHLRPETLAYTVMVEFDLPRIGNYQLLAFVLLPDNGAVGITLGPVLSVIP